MTLSPVHFHNRVLISRTLINNSHPVHLMYWSSIGSDHKIFIDWRAQLIYIHKTNEIIDPWYFHSKPINIKAIRLKRVLLHVVFWYCLINFDFGYFFFHSNGSSYWYDNFIRAYLIDECEGKITLPLKPQNHQWTTTAKKIKSQHEFLVSYTVVHLFYYTCACFSLSSCYFLFGTSTESPKIFITLYSEHSVSQSRTITMKCVFLLSLFIFIFFFFFFFYFLSIAFLITTITKPCSNL